MKKVVVSAIRKTGEKIAALPIDARTFPVRLHQPEMPAVLRERMDEMDKK